MRIIACAKDPVVIQKILTHQKKKTRHLQTLPVTRIPGAAQSAIRLTAWSPFTSNAVPWRSTAEYRLTARLEWRLRGSP